MNPMAGALVAAFAAGLLGGVHCVGMCGGIAGALAGAARGNPLRRLLAFNAGRIASYATAGAAAGALGGIAALLGPLHAARVAMFIVAQVMLMMLGVYIAGWGGMLLRLEKLGGALWRGLEPLRRRAVPIDSDAQALAAGALWGWVPCGLVYGMLPFAIATGSAAGGAGILAMFGLGTLPSLLLAGSAGGMVAQLRRRAWVRRTAGGLIVTLAVLSLLHMPAAGELASLAWLCIHPDRP
jgi:sulfite exporter TauE/SafE